MCKAMQRNENHFGRVTFPPYERALPPLPPPWTPHRDHTGPDTDPPRRCRDRFTAAPTPTHRTTTLWNPSRGPPPSVASGTRRLHRSVGVLKHGRFMAGGRGAVRHSSSGCYWSEPSPRRSLLRPRQLSGVRACVHVWQPLTTRPRARVDDQRFSPPASDHGGSTAAF